MSLGAIERERSRLTARAAVLLVAVTILGVFAVVPGRELLDHQAPGGDRPPSAPPPSWSAWPASASAWCGRARSLWSWRTTTGTARPLTFPGEPLRGLSPNRPIGRGRNRPRPFGCVS